MSQLSIIPQQLAELVRRAKVDLIDVRKPIEFQTAHIESARNWPLDTLEPEAVMDGRDPSRPLYVVCQAGGRGAKACAKLRAAGYENVVNVEGGTQAWIDAGLPVVRGRQAISLERQVRIAAGLLVLLGIALGYVWNVKFVWLSALVGGGLVFAGITDTCGMGLLLARMPWNRSTPPSCITEHSN